MSSRNNDSDYHPHDDPEYEDQGQEEEVSVISSITGTTGMGGSSSGESGASSSGSSKKDVGISWKTHFTLCGKQ